MMKLNIQLFAVSKSTTFSESNISEINNTSSLTINIYFSANNTSTFFINYPLKCTCNGVTQTKDVSHPKGGSCSVSFTFNNIKHNSDGSKSVSWSWSCATGTSVLGTIKDSGTKELTKINRESKINTSNWSTAETPVEQAKTLEIEKYNDNYYHKLLVYVGNVLVATRTGIDGDYSFQFTQEELNNNVYPNITSNMAAINFMLYTYTDDTMEEQVGDYSGVWYRGTIINANPNFTDFEYEDSNSTTIALTNNSNKIVQGYSTLKVTIPVEDKATGQKGATISGYNIGNYSVAYSDTTDVVKEIPNYSSENIVVSAVDSRGNSKSITKLFTDNFINYTDVVILNCEVNREDEIGEKVKIKFNGTWWQNNFGGANGGGILNELTATYQYQTGNGEWINGTTPLTLDTSEFGKFSCEQYIVGDTGNGFNISNSYKIKVIVSDKLSSKPKTKELIAGEPAIAIFGNKVSFNSKYDESKSNMPVQIKGNPVVYYPVGAIYMSVDSTNPSEIFGGTWEAFAQGRVLVGVDTNQIEFNEVEKTGGSKFLQEHTHTINSAGAHTHNVKALSGSASGSGSCLESFGNGAPKTRTVSGAALSAGSHTHTMSSAGDGDSENLQPYITCYMWKRTA